MSAKNLYLNLKKFEFKKFLGNGSFGKVNLVEDIETKVKYAAKISKDQFEDEEDEESDFVLSLFREIKIMSSIVHPSIIQYVGYSPTDFEDLKRPTIILEYAPNGTLEAILESERSGRSHENWNDTTKLICIYGIAAGMSFLHAHNIIHRDLKTDNVLMDSYLHPKIADFGLSKINDAITRSLRIQSQLKMKGTPLFMAPELFEKCPLYSKSSDVYAFALIVYEIMTGLLPFQKTNIVALMGQVCAGCRPRITENVPEVYSNLIKRCWSQNPDERPSFSEIINEIKTNSGYITELVEEDIFWEYVDFVDHFNETFDLKRQSIHLNTFMNPKTKGFKRFSIRIESNKVVEIISDDEFNKIQENSSNQSNAKADSNKINQNTNNRSVEGHKIVENLKVIEDPIDQDDKTEDEFNEIQENSSNQSNAKADVKEIKQNTTNHNVENNNNEIYDISQNCTVNSNSIILEEKGSTEKAEKDFELAKENDYLQNKDDDKIEEQQMPKIKKQEIQFPNYQQKTIKLKALFLGKMSTHVLYYLTKGPMDYIPSVFDNYMAKFVVNDKINVNLQLWDTVREIPGDLAVLEFTNTDIFVLVYSLLDISSLVYYSEFKIPQIMKYVRKPVFLMLGVDLEKWKNDQNNQDYISQKEIEFFEKKYSVVDSIKVSLVTGENFDHIYDKIILAHLYKLNILKPNNKCSIY